MVSRYSKRSKKSSRGGKSKKAKSKKPKSRKASRGRGRGRGVRGGELNFSKTDVLGIMAAAALGSGAKDLTKWGFGKTPLGNPGATRVDVNRVLEKLNKAAGNNN